MTADDHELRTRALRAYRRTTGVAAPWGVILVDRKRDGTAAVTIEGQGSVLAVFAWNGQRLRRVEPKSIARLVV